MIGLKCVSKLVYASESQYVYIDSSIGSFPEVSVNEEGVLHLISHGRSEELLLEGIWNDAEQIADFMR